MSVWEGGDQERSSRNGGSGGVDKGLSGVAFSTQNGRSPRAWRNIEEHIGMNQEIQAGMYCWDKNIRDINIFISGDIHLANVCPVQISRLEVRDWTAKLET